MTAMQDLRSDLLESVLSCKESLHNINNEFIRKTCITMLESTVKSIIKRIDEELLEMEKKQIIDAVMHGLCNNEVVEMANYSEIYYNETKQRMPKS